MARCPLNLPKELKKEAEEWAEKLKVSLNQFIMWSVVEKGGELRQSLDDLDFPRVTYRRGAAGVPTPVIRGTGVRVQTVVIARQHWGLSPSEIAEEYSLTENQVSEALSFCKVHQVEIDEAIERDESLEAEHV